MVKRPIGSILSGELTHLLWREREINIFQYYSHYRAITGKLRYDGERYFLKQSNTNFEIPFDLAGFLHVMNSPQWGVVVFTNYFFAYAYERKANVEDAERRPL